MSFAVREFLNLAVIQPHIIGIVMLGEHQESIIDYIHELYTRGETQFIFSAEKIKCLLDNLSIVDQAETLKLYFSYAFERHAQYIAIKQKIRQWQPNPVKVLSKIQIQETLSLVEQTCELAFSIHCMEWFSHQLSPPVGSEQSRFTRTGDFSVISKGQFQLHLLHREQFNKIHQLRQTKVHFKHIQKDELDNEGVPDLMVTMLEPSAESYEIGSNLFTSDLELSLMSNEQFTDFIYTHQKIINDLNGLHVSKRSVDDFYKNRIFQNITLPPELGNWVMTCSTSPYFAHHIVFMSDLGRQSFDTATIIEQTKYTQEKSFSEYHGKTYEKSHIKIQANDTSTLPSISNKFININAVKHAISDSYQPSVHKDNVRTQILVVAELMRKLPPNIVLAQNSPIASFTSTSIFIFVPGKFSSSWQISS